MKKILIIAYVFPPIAYAGTHRTLRLCRHLSKKGYDIDVLTIDVQKDLHNDFQLLEEINDRVRIIRTPIYDPYRFHRKVKTKISTYGLIGKIVSSIVGRTAELISKPDHMLFWICSAIRPGITMIRKNKYSIIYTTSPPHSEQILGYFLKKKFPELKWVADMRDPIMDNLIIDNVGFVNRKIHGWVEKKIAEYSNMVIFNTHYAFEKFKLRHPSSTVRHIRNSYDEYDFNEEPVELFKKFTIAHVGSIYSFRNVDPLFEAISILEKTKAIEKEHFRLFFVGMHDNSLKRKMETYGIKRFVETNEMVPHKIAIETMKKSHFLLLIKGFGKNSDSQIPGKLYEYIAAGNPILHIGPEDCEAANIIDGIKAGQTFSNNVKELADYIKSAYNEFKKETVIVRKLRDGRHEFSSEDMGNKMHQAFESLR